MTDTFALKRIGEPTHFVLQRVSPSVPDGGGSGTGSEPVGDLPDMPFPVLAGGSPPIEVIVSWDVEEASIEEGNPVAWNVRLSKGVQGVTHIPVVLTGTVTPSTIDYTELIQFDPGQEEKLYIVRTYEPAGGASSETAIFTLDADAAYVDPADPNEPLEVEYILDTDPGVGFETCTLTITDIAAPATPIAGFSSPTASIGEGFQPPEINISLVLDGPSTTDVILHVAHTGGTGTNDPEGGGDFIFTDQDVLIEQGTILERFPWTVVDNDVDSPSDQTCELTVTLVAGDATLVGGNSVLTITILDNDDDPGGPSGVHRVEWIATSQTINEGAYLILDARVVDDADDLPFPFTAVTEVPLIITHGSTNEQEHFGVNWQGTNTPGFLTFSPGELSRRIVVQAPPTASGDSHTIQVQIGVPPMGENTWVVGTPAALTIASQHVNVGGGPENAKIIVAPHRNATRRVIQFQAAVVPPAEVVDLPNYTLVREGVSSELVQIVQMSRLADRKVDSVYCYAFDDGTESYAVGATGTNMLTLRAAMPGDLDPPENFSTVFQPDITFTLTVSNGSGPYTCGSASGEYMRAQEWTSPTGNSVFRQIGADIVRESSYMARPHLASATGAQETLLSSTGDAVGMIDWCIKSFAGDPDVFIVEGRLMNATYSSADDPQVESNFCDGTINIEEFEVAGDAGWTIDPGPHAHTSMSTVAANSIHLLSNRTTSYLMRPGKRMAFWFVVRKTSAGVAAQERGEDYLLSKNVGWAVGELGSTRQPIYGDKADLTIDYERLGLQHISVPNLAGTPLTGWRAIKHIGEHHAGELTWGGHGASWASGGAPGDTSPDTLNERLGMWHFTGDAKMGPGGFSGKHPTGALIPHWGWWDRTRYMHEYGMQRIDTSIRDVVTGDPAWWWLTLRPDGTTGFVGNMGYNVYHRKLWSMNYPGQSGGGKTSVDKPEYAQSPTTRVFNEPLMIAGSMTVASLTSSLLTITGTIPAATPAVGTVMVTADSGTVFGYTYSARDIGAGTFTAANSGDWNRATPSDEDFAAGNLVESSYGDIQWTEIEGFPALAVTHMGFLRTGIQDGWYCCRRYTAFRDYEEVAAQISRAMVPHQNIGPEPTGTWSTTQLTSCYGGIRAVYSLGDLGGEIGTNPIDWYQTGEFLTSSRVFAGGPAAGEFIVKKLTSVRGLARAITFVSGFSAITTHEQLLQIRGEDPLVQLAGGVVSADFVDLLGTAFRIADFITSPAGVLSSVGFGAQPNPYSVETGTGNSMEAPNLVERTGAWPSENALNGGTGPGSIVGSGPVIFHQTYFVIAVDGAMRRSYIPTAAQPTMARLWDWLEHTLVGRESLGGGFGADSLDCLPYMLTIRMDDYATSFANGPPHWTGSEGVDRTPRATPVAEIRAGMNVWSFRRQGEDFEYYGGLHKWKAPAAGFASDKRVGPVGGVDDYYIKRHFGKVFERSTNVAASEIVEHLVRTDSPLGGNCIEDQFSSSSGGSISKTYKGTSITINVPMIAYLLNQYT